MTMLPGGISIYGCTSPIDMRKSFDGLALATKQILGKEPQSKSLFVFINKRANRLKVLWWDDNGYCLLYKRVHDAHFRLPAGAKNGGTSIRIDSGQLKAMLRGIAKEKRNVRSARA